MKEFNRFKNRVELKTYHEIFNTNLFHARDEEWKKIRKITANAFNTIKIKKLCGLVKICIDEYLDFLGEVTEKGNSFDVKCLFNQFTLEVISYCLLSKRTNSIKDPNNQIVESFEKLFFMKASKIIPAFLFPKLLNKILNIKCFLDHDTNEYIINLLKNIIDERKQEREKNNDFLQLLIDDRLEETRRKFKDESNTSPLLNDGNFKLIFH